MSINKKVSLTLSISKTYRDILRTMAALQNLENPDLLTSASTIAREILCEYIDNNGSIEDDFNAAVNAPNLHVESELNDSSEVPGGK